MYCNYVMKSKNKRTIDLIKICQAQQNRIMHILQQYHNTLTTIYTLNEFWKNVFSSITYVFVPFCLICLEQLMYEQLSPILFFGMLSTIISVASLLVTLNLITANIFEEVLAVRKVIFKLIISLKDNSSLKTKLKVIIKLFKNIHLF